MYDFKSKDNFFKIRFPSKETQGKKLLKLYVNVYYIKHLRLSVQKRVLSTYVKINTKNITKEYGVQWGSFTQPKHY